MSEIPRVHTLVWTMELLEQGFTCWTLTEPSGRRWGWVVNSGAAGWLAHVGDWGQAAPLGLPSVPVREELQRKDTAAEGRSWVEENLARQWASGKPTALAGDTVQRASGVSVRLASGETLRLKPDVLNEAIAVIHACTTQEARGNYQVADLHMRDEHGLSQQDANSYTRAARHLVAKGIESAEQLAAEGQNTTHE